MNDCYPIIVVADSVAKTAKQIAVEDEKIISELEKTGGRLSAAIDATESLTETLKGTEGGSSIDAVSNAVDQTAAIVKEDLSAAESIANAVSQKVVMEAEAVIALDEKAAGSVTAVRAAEASIQESVVESGSGALASALAKDATDIKVDVDTAERLARAIQEDATNDEEALEVLERSSSEVNSLIDAVDDLIDKAEDVTTGKASADNVAVAVDKIEDEVKQVEESMLDVEEATGECEDCNVKKLTEEMEDEAKAKESTHSGSEEKIESDKEESKHALVEEEPAEERVRVVSENNSEVDDERGEFNIEEERGLAANAKPEVEVEAKQELDTELMAESSSKAGADVDSSVSVGHDMAVEPPEATITASVDHAGAGSLGDAAASTADGAQHVSDTMVADAAKASANAILGGDLADAVANANPLEGLGNALVSAESAASGAVEFITSPDRAHDMAASTTEALGEAVALVSSSL